MQNTNFLQFAQILSGIAQTNISVEFLIQSIQNKTY